jgi:hypothetical protein
MNADETDEASNKIKPTWMMWLAWRWIDMDMS